MNIEIRRVSNQVLAWLDDPSSVPPDQPHCQFCNAPKRERGKSCEVCGQHGSITGPKKQHGNVYVEHYRRRFVRIERKK